MSLLEKDITKRWVDKMTSKRKFENDGDGEEYKVEAICDSAVNTKKSETHLPGLHYLVFWKDHPNEKNTWEPALVI